MLYQAKDSYGFTRQDQRLYLFVESKQVESGTLLQPVLDNIVCHREIKSIVPSPLAGEWQAEDHKQCFQVSQVVQWKRTCLPMQEEGCKDPLKKEMATGKKEVTHSSILAWRIPWTEEPGQL